MPAFGKALLAGGARLIQLRAKLAPSARLLDYCLALAEAAHGSGTVIVVNDRFDVALAANLRAVHVGQDDLPPALVRRFLGPEGVVGVSTHTRAQVDAALYDPVDYIAVGPVYGTVTKDTGYEPVGLELVAYAASRATVPIVAIGGITLDTARAVLDAGAASVAVIGDLLTGGTPSARVARYLSALR